MSKDKQFKNVCKVALLMGLAITIFQSLAILYINSQDTPGVNFKQETTIPGYETSPATYEVQASSSKMWADTWDSVPLLIVIGLILGFASGWPIILEDSKPANEKSRWYIASTLGTVLLSFILVFGWYWTKWGDSSYISTLCVDTYQSVKDNLDLIFPSVEEPLNCK